MTKDVYKLALKMHVFQCAYINFFMSWSHDIMAITMITIVMYAIVMLVRRRANE